MDALTALLLTLAVELPIVCWLGRRMGLPVLRLVAVGVLASCLTHPMVWHLAQKFGPQEYQQAVWALEVGVWAAEALLYRTLVGATWRQAAGLSGLANLASYAVGAVWLRSL